MKKKRALLINPHIEDFAAYDHYSKPLGLIYLASYLKDRFELHFINALQRNHPALPDLKTKPDKTGNFYKTPIKKPEILSDIPRKFKRYGLPDEVFISELKKTPFVPDFVFITSGMTYWYRGVIHTINLVRETFPDTKILLGGIYPSIIPSHAKKHSTADFVIPSQDMRTVLRMINDICETEIQYNGYRNPDYSLLGEYRYAPVLTSVGCVFSCDYCISSKLNKFMQFPPEAVADCIISLYRDYGVKDFAFYDDALLFNAENHLAKILSRVISAGIETRFYTPNGLHIRFIDKKIAGLMKKAGFMDIHLSLESVSPAFHGIKDRKTTPDEFKRALETLFCAGFTGENIKVYALLNTPGSLSAEEETLEYIRQCGATPKTALYSPIPGTPDFEKAMRITEVNEPLFQNNTVYLYRSGFADKYAKYKSENK